MGLAVNLRAFVSQRLVKTVDGKRCAAVEILLGTKTISELILKGQFQNIKEIMEKSESLGMQTFDAALFKLYKQGKISEEEALRNADSANNLRLRIKLSDDDSGVRNGIEQAITASNDAPAPEAPKKSGFTLELESIEDPEDEEPDAAGGMGS
jgi:twitching motility protein PilU